MNGSFSVNQDRLSNGTAVTWEGPTHTQRACDAPMQKPCEKLENCEPRWCSARGRSAGRAYSVQDWNGLPRGSQSRPSSQPPSRQHQTQALQRGTAEQDARHSAALPTMFSDPGTSKWSCAQQSGDAVI